MSKAKVVQIFLTTLVRLVLQSGSSISVLLINGFFGQASVALYSVAYAAILLIVLVFGNGLHVLLLRGFAKQDEPDSDAFYKRFQATLARSPGQYAKAGLLALLAALYLFLSIGPEAVKIFVLMSPLLLILPSLNLRSSYHKALGQPVRASIYQAGLFHLTISILILLAVISGTQDLSNVFIAGFILLSVASVIIMAKTLKTTRSVKPLRDPAAQMAILFNALLNFTLRNGFPLFFAAFMATEDLGSFRVEERLFFLLMFLYFLFEVVSVKYLIKIFREGETAHRIRRYVLLSGSVFTVGLLAAITLLFALSLHPVANFIGYSWQGDWTVLMAFSAPFYMLALFNGLVLDLGGRHFAVTRCTFAGAIIFLLGTFFVYSSLGIDGVRLAYFCGGMTSAVLSVVAVLFLQLRATKA